MATSHHGATGPDPEQARIMDRFLKQMEGRAVREYPQGRVGAADDGALALAVTADPRTGTVILDFGKPVKWIGLKPADVAALCELLMNRAREVSTEPLTLQLG